MLSVTKAKSSMAALDLDIWQATDGIFPELWLDEGSWPTNAWSSTTPDIDAAIIAQADVGYRELQQTAPMAIPSPAIPATDSTLPSSVDSYTQGSVTSSWRASPMAVTGEFREARLLETAPKLQRNDSVQSIFAPPETSFAELAHPPSVDPYAQQGGIVSHRSSPYTSLGMTKQEHGTTPQTASDRENRHEDEAQRLMCSECGLEFENLQGLDKHSRSSLHKAWRCHEPGCGKTYARRDTFLRHRIKHTDSVHVCHICLRGNKQKVFKRKDHLKEHIRNCHSGSVETIM